MRAPKQTSNTRRLESKVCVERGKTNIARFGNRWRGPSLLIEPCIVVLLHSQFRNRHALRAESNAAAPTCQVSTLLEAILPKFSSGGP